MNRRNLLAGLAAVTSLAWLGRSKAASTPISTIIKPLKKAKADWKTILPAAAYAVLFEEDTERSGSSELNQEHRDGVFVCAACHLPLFSSKAKFDSGTGWPSFTYPMEGHTASKSDYKLVWPRTEYHCARCGGHQGHVFDDGPKPTGQRWCNNGVALKFILKGTALPALRT
ncbi:MAG: peptide-methionine (R)-S-oxide reductase MsrB [Arenimonas sp.]